MKPSNVRTILALLAGLAACAAVAGCVKLKKDFPEKRYYVLAAARPERAPASPGAPILEIRKFRASPNLEGKELVYRTGDLLSQSDFYNLFFSAPAAMATEETRQWLSRSGLFRQVVDSSSHLQASHILEGRLVALHGDYRDPAKPRAILELQVFLLLDSPSEPRILFSGEYRREVALKEPDPPALAVGLSEALRQVLSALEEDLRQVEMADPAKE